VPTWGSFLACFSKLLGFSYRSCTVVLVSKKLSVQNFDLEILFHTSSSRQPRISKTTSCNNFGDGSLIESTQLSNGKINPYLCTCIIKFVSCRPLSVAL
jgi:hypothetical protein